MIVNMQSNIQHGVDVLGNDFCMLGLEVNLEMLRRDFLLEVLWWL